MIDAGINEQEAHTSTLAIKLVLEHYLKRTFPFYYGVTSQIINDQYFIKH